MYKQFFGLKENPFNVTPDPKYLYSTPHTEEALACLTYGVQARKGFVLLTGDVGTGKTTLLNKLLEWLRQEEIASAFVFNPRLNPFQFLDYALSDFGVNCESRLKSVILADLNNWLLERHKAGSTAVLVVDEAQDASPELLEEIRLLTNLEIPSGKLLQIVLSGQQELEMKLRLPEFRQLRQRITLRAKTHPLTLEETHEYVATRLRIAGSDGRVIFAPEAIDSIHHYSEGIPRIINILCEDSLVGAFASHQAVISKEVVEEMARELELDIYPPTAPPPAAQTLDDLIQPLGRSDGGRPAPQKAPSPRIIVSQPIVREPLPAPSTQSAGPGPAAVEIAARPPAIRGPVKWEGAQPSVDPGWTEEADARATVTRAFKAPPQQTQVAAEKPTADEEILQALQGKETVPKSMPAVPVAAPPQIAPKTVVISPPFRVSATPPPSQNRVLWLALIAALVAGAGGAFLIWRYTAQTVHSGPTLSPEVHSANQSPVLPAVPPAASTAESPAAVNPAPAPSVSAQNPAPPLPEPAAKPQPTPQSPATRIDTVPARTEPAARPSSPAPTPARTRPAARPVEPVEEPRSSQPVGRAVVTSNIEGAKITIDGRTTGEWVTPYEFTGLSVGAHTVVISKPGYEDVATRMTVREGQTSVFRASLTASGGEITIITDPPGLPVSFDGGPFQPSPVQVSLPAGTHTYRIQLPNSRIYDGKVEMRTGAIITRRVDFTAAEWLNPVK